MSTQLGFFDQSLVSINGVIKKPQEAMISVFDRSFLFGDSIYEATLIKNKVPLFWQEHLSRLKNSASLIGLSLNSINFNQLETWIENLISNLTSDLGLLRLVVTRGLGPVNIAPLENTENNVVIFALPLHYPSEWYQVGLKYYISSYERNSPKSLNPQAKTGNYLNSQLALVEAKKEGFHDALLINHNGYITEGTTNNFWYIKNKVLYTADNDQGVLKGITRDKIFQIGQKNGYSIKLGSWRLEQVLAADEAFMTSATKGVVPIVQLSQWKIGNGKPGPITNQLRNLYENLVEEYITAKKWKMA